MLSLVTGNHQVRLQANWMQLYPVITADKSFIVTFFLKAFWIIPSNKTDDATEIKINFNASIPKKYNTAYHWQEQVANYYI